MPLARVLQALAAIFIIALSAFGVHAQGLQPVPALTARVIDATGTLDAAQTAALEAKLAALEQDKGAQVVVLMVPTTAPEDIAAYAERQILMRDAKNLQAAGAFAVVLEVVPHELADAVTRSLAIPTIGIGAGASTDAQVLVWQDLAGLTPGTPAKFVKQYADLRGYLTEAVTAWAGEVVAGTYPDADHQYS